MYGDRELGILPGQNLARFQGTDAPDDFEGDDDCPVCGEPRSCCLCFEFDEPADEPEIIGLANYCEFCGSGPTCIVCRRGLDPLPTNGRDEELPF